VRAVRQPDAVVSRMREPRKKDRSSEHEGSHWHRVRHRVVRANRTWSRSTSKLLATSMGSAVYTPCPSPPLGITSVTTPVRSMRMKAFGAKFEDPAAALPTSTSAPAVPGENQAAADGGSDFQKTAPIEVELTRSQTSSGFAHEVAA